MEKNIFKRVTALFAVAILTASIFAEEVSLLNVSFDVSREFYRDFNFAFAKYYKVKTGKDLKVRQSHGGSSKQTRGVIDGLEADVVTLNQATDLDLLASKYFIPQTWKKSFPYGSSPFSSTVVFLVRSGNPKQIKDWNDLVKPGVQIILPNPKTSGNGRYSYLAAYAYAQRKGGEKTAGEFVRQLLANAPILPTGGRDATTAFARREQGDVLLTFESEVLQITKNFGVGKFEIVTPSESIKAEFPIAVVERYAEKHGTRELAHEYLNYLYSSAGQQLGVKHYYRPADPGIAAKHSGKFAKIKLVSIEEVFGDWKSANEQHFADKALFDQLYTKK